MAQYALHGIYTQSQPAYGPARAVVPHAPALDSYNATYLNATAQCDNASAESRETPTAFEI